MYHVERNKYSHASSSASRRIASFPTIEQAIDLAMNEWTHGHHRWVQVIGGSGMVLWSNGAFAATQLKSGPSPYDRARELIG